PDCPYCRQLEKELGGLDDVTLWVFLFPIADLHPAAEARARALWCAPDRAAAWTQWMQQHQEPPANACESTPLAQLQALGRSLYIAATPTMFLPDGERLLGVQSAARLSQLLDAATASQAPSVAAAHVPVRSER